MQKCYGNMGSTALIEEAAQIAGGKLAQGMRTMVRSQPGLSGYQQVAEGFTTWTSDDGAIHVGLPPGHSLVEQAVQMEQQFSVKQTSMDMDLQTGDTRQAFYDALTKLAGL